MKKQTQNHINELKAELARIEELNSLGLLSDLEYELEVFSLQGAIAMAYDHDRKPLVDTSKDW